MQHTNLKNGIGGTANAFARLRPFTLFFSAFATLVDRGSGVHR